MFPNSEEVFDVEPSSRLSSKTVHSLRKMNKRERVLRHSQRHSNKHIPLSIVIGYRLLVLLLSLRLSQDLWTIYLKKNTDKKVE